MRIIILCLIFITTGCYGESVKNNNTVKNRIQDTYKTIRKKIEDNSSKQDILDVIYEDRIKHKISFAEDEEIEFSSEEIENIVNGVLSFDDDKILSRENIYELAKEFVSRFDFEKSIWDFEQDLLEEMQILPSYSNESESDGQFDHIQNWNIIDEILFEDKNEETDASFGKIIEKFSKEKEDWQNGDPRQEGKGSSSFFSYSEDKESIASQIYLIKEKLENSLNTRQLLTEVNNKMFFESTVMPPCKKKSTPVFTVKLPTIKKIPPEVSQLETDKFIGIENILLDNTECGKVVIPFVGTSKEKSNDNLISNCRVLRSIISKRNNEAMGKMGDLKQYVYSGYKSSNILEFLDDHFWALYLEIKELNRVLQDISKPCEFL